MSQYKTNQFKAGLKIMIDGDPCSIVTNEMVKPGKGQAFNRVKIRNLKTNRVIEKTLISQPGRTVCDSISINKPRSARCVSADTSHQQK